MTFCIRAAMFVRRAALSAVVGTAVASAGCSPYSTAAKIGIKVVGEVVNDADVKQHANDLVGRPVASADAVFGRRLRTLEEVNTRREVVIYPVKDDLLSMFRWAVEAENGRIVALSKLQNDPDGGKDIAEKIVLKEIVIGKTPKALEAHTYFQKLVLVLRDRAAGDMIRVYDIALIPDFLGAKYCVLRFDGSNTCQEVRIVGVPASTSGSAIGR
jgi:hypothetical protein